MKFLLFPLLFELLIPATRGSLFTRLSRRWDQHELSKIKEIVRIPRASSTKPFLPFSNLGAPAGPIKSNNTVDKVANNIHSIENGIYTTLDKLPKSSFKKKPNYKKTGENLGGLTPEEIFYIDKDIVIIKGGDFRDSTYEKARLISKKKIDERTIKAIKKFSFNKENDLDNRSSTTHPSPSQLPTSQLSLFLPSLHVPENSHRYYQYMYHPTFIRGIQTNPYYTFRKPYYLSIIRDPYSGKLKYTSSLTNNLEYNIPFLLPKPQKMFSRLHAPFPTTYSLAKDTDINYKFPRPSPHPDAEWFVNKVRIKRE